jgi:hypothetical protein
MAEWALLPSAVSSQTFHSVEQRLTKQTMREFLQDAGLRVRRDRGRLRLRSNASDHRPLLELYSLQDGTGRFRSDAAQVLSGASSLSGFGADLQEMLPRMLSQPGAQPQQDLNYWGRLQLAFWDASDPLAALSQLHAGQRGFRFYVVHPTDKLLKRLIIWRVLEHLLAGHSVDTLPVGVQRNRTTLIDGIVEFTAATLVCAPLVARNQPLAAVFMTSSGIQVIGILEQGAFVRGLQMPPWPSGTGGPSLYGGSGKGVYKTRLRELPSGYGEALLTELVRGMNSLLSYLTDPTQWTNEAGELDNEERLITWMSVRFGLDALSQLGSEWKSEWSVWTAFRAMSILQGIWLGSRSRGVKLNELLDPRLIKSYALDTFTNLDSKRWAEDVLGNYTRALQSSFPDEDLDSLLPKIEEMRHLVHGAGATPTTFRQRTSRLFTLRALADNPFESILFNDVAAFWWTSVVLHPARNCKVGHAPWES